MSIVYWSLRFLNRTQFDQQKEAHEMDACVSFVSLVSEEIPTQANHEQHCQTQNSYSHNGVYSALGVKDRTVLLSFLCIILHP